MLRLGVRALTRGLFLENDRPRHLDSKENRPYDVRMDVLRFEWDERKNESNKRKHGVSFEEAQTAFYDEYATLFFDPDHSEREERFILLGVSVKLNVVIVCHCCREKDNVVRLISARKADKNEERDYWRRRR